MACPFLDLPQELLTKIVLALHFEDVVSLKRTSKDFFTCLSSEENSSTIFKKNIRYTQEADEITYSSAVRRVSNRKQAFASARPFSAIVLGHGKSFLYKEGFLCYVHKDTIRILDVLYGSVEEYVIDLRMLFRQGVKGWDLITAVSDFATAWFEVEIIQCEAGILSAIVADEDTSCLITIDFRPEVPVTATFEERVRLVLRGAWPGAMMGGPRPGIRVRHTERFLYYISNHRQGGRDTWAINMRQFDAETNGAFPEMRDLFLTGPGESIAVKIYDGWIYALSNQSTIAHLDEIDGTTLIEENDPTSYYQCYRFRTDDFDVASRNPFNSSPPTLEMVRIWRRQPMAEPKHNTLWADLVLHVDECTGELVIVETRQAPDCEKSSCGPMSYEFQPLNFEHPVDYGDFPPLSVTHRTLAGDFEMGYHIQGQHDKPNGEPPHYRPRYETPTEAAPEESLPHHPRLSPITSTKEALKYRTYNPTCHSFLDLFLRENLHNHRLNTSDHPTHHHQRVQIEIGSRTRVSPIDEQTGLLTPQERFTDGAVQTWPPPNAPDALNHLLNPFSTRPCDLRADSDERSIVYMIRPVDGQPRQRPLKNGLKFNIGDLTSDQPGGFKIGDVFKGEGLSDAPVGSGERILRYWPAEERENGVIVDSVQEIPITESMRRREEGVEGDIRVEGTAEMTKPDEEEEGAIVLVNFDGEHWRGFGRLRLGSYDDDDDDDDDVSSITNTLANENINVVDEGGEEDPERKGKDGEGKGKEPEKRGEECESNDADRRWFRREQAM